MLGKCSYIHVHIYAYNNLYIILNSCFIRIIRRYRLTCYSNCIFYILVYSSVCFVPSIILSMMCNLYLFFRFYVRGNLS